MADIQTQARILYRLVEAEGGDESEGRVVTYRELVELTGASRSSCIRAVHQIREAGIDVEGTQAGIWISPREADRVDLQVLARLAGAGMLGHSPIAAAIEAEPV